MNIAYILMQFPAPSETFACHDVKALRDLGAKLSVFSLRGKHKKHEQMIADRNIEDINIFSFGRNEFFIGAFVALTSPIMLAKIIVWILFNEYKSIKSIAKCFAVLPASFYVAKNIKEIQPDVVHLFWGHYPAVAGYLIKQKFPEVKLTMFLGAYDLEYKLPISKSLVKQAGCIFTHSMFNCKALYALGVEKSKVEVIYRGICTESSIFYPNSLAKRKPYTWLSAGRLIKAKGFEKVINLFGLVNKMKRMNGLVIAGSGPELSNLKSCSSRLGLESRVEFSGHVSQSCLYEKMLSSDFFILLSSKRGERLPNVIKEAMLAGCVCITSKTPGIEELITHGETGFVVDENNLEAIAELVNEVDPKIKDRIRVSAQSIIKNEFDVKVSMSKYLAVWRAL